MLVLYLVADDNVALQGDLCYLRSETQRAGVSLDIATLSGELTRFVTG